MAEPDGFKLGGERSALPEGSLTARAIYRRSGEIFGREASCDAYRLSTRLTAIAGLLAFCYTLIISCAGLSPITAAWRDAWVGALQQVTDAVAQLVPSVRGLAADLAGRGFSARVPFVSHVIAAQWILFAGVLVVAAAIIMPERRRLRRAFDAADEERERLRAGAINWRPWVVVPCFGLFMAWTPFDSASHFAGRRLNYDLATSDGGLFWFVFKTWFWWGILYHMWLRFLAFVLVRGSD